MKSPKQKSLVPVVAGVVCSTVVFGAIAFVLKLDGATPAKTAKSPEAKPQSVAAAPQNATPAVDVKKVEPVVAISKAELAQAPVQVEPAQAPIAKNEISSRDRISSQLAAGEFGPALAAAQAVADPAERNELVKLVVQAQVKAGEFENAAVAVRQLSARENQNNKSETKESLAGGSGADYDTLIDLIVNNTVGPWESVGGDGSPDPTEYDNGVRVDPNGMLFRLTQAELNGRLKTLGDRARAADLNQDMSASSTMRLVSLTRLEKEIARRLAAGQPVLETMRHLAGLSQVQHVFVYPEQGEIVIGGPAEGWRIDPSGASIGTNSGRPTLQLDDLVTVLRTFGPDGDAVFRCSINPRQEGLANIRQFAAQSNARGALDSSSVASWTKQLEQKLGVQDIVVNGVPVDSRVARVIVEADYRMKLIGIGKLDNQVGIPSWFDLLPPEQQKASPETTALRWWMTMKYDSVLHSPNKDVYEIQGSSVLCQSENEMIADGGKRVHTGQADATNQMFAKRFTDSFADLASHDPIFGDLQNVFDLALVAALIRHERLDERANWNQGVFATNGDYVTAKFEPPQTVMSVVNHRVYPGGNIVVQVAGGVRGDLMTVVQNESVYKEASRLANSHDRGKAPVLPEGRWWWDAAK